MGNSNASHGGIAAKSRPQPLLFFPKNKTDPTIYEQIQNHCHSKPNIPSCICIRNYIQPRGSVILSTQNCHLLLSVVNFFRSMSTAKRNLEIIKYTNSEDHILYSIKIKSVSWGEDWSVLCIDYMNQAHPDYEFKGITSSANNQFRIDTQCLYFIPRSNEGK